MKWFFANILYRFKNLTGVIEFENSKEDGKSNNSSDVFLLFTMLRPRRVHSFGIRDQIIILKTESNILQYKPHDLPTII